MMKDSEGLPGPNEAVGGVSRRYLQFRNWRTGEIDRRIEVTGRSEREIERCERGMLINIGEDWLVDDVT